MSETTQPGSWASIPTPMKVILAGGVLALFEAILDIIFAEWYTGEYAGIELTETDIIMSAIFGAMLVVLILVWGYLVRDEPTQRVYLVILLLAIAGLVVGTLFANVIIAVGAGLGWWGLRNA